jgi:hypothetical protein
MTVKLIMALECVNYCASSCDITFWRSLPSSICKPRDLDPSLLQNEFGDTTGFGYDFASSPGIWINGNPAQTDPVTRKLERDAAGL